MGGRGATSKTSQTKLKPKQNTKATGGIVGRFEQDGLFDLIKKATNLDIRDSISSTTRKFGGGILIEQARTTSTLDRSLIINGKKIGPYITRIMKMAIERRGYEMSDWDPYSVLINKK